MSNTGLRLKIVLAETKPPIWRRVEVPAETTLANLHAVIQAAMGWTDSHLDQFHVGRETIDGPGLESGAWGEPPSIRAGRVRLDGLVAGGVKGFVYVYDMGDCWEHRFRIEKSLPADPTASYPRLVDGALCCPPEDVGGVPGFYEFLEAMSDPEHPDHEDVIEWYGDEFDPVEFDIERLRKDLGKTAGRRRRTVLKP